MMAINHYLWGFNHLPIRRMRLVHKKRDLLKLSPQEHKEARDQLLAQAVENSFECIRTTDESGIITFANRTCGDAAKSGPPLAVKIMPGNRDR